MKRSALCILTLFALLVATPLAAQTGSDETQRTQPDAPSVAPHSGLTIEGTVTSWNDRELVLETETGVEHLVLTRDLNLPASLSKGDQVAIDYTRNSQGTMVANEVRLNVRVKLLDDVQGKAYLPALVLETSLQ